MTGGRRIEALVLFAGDDRTLSYQLGWPAGFAAHSRFRVTLVDVSARRPRRFVDDLRVRRRPYEVVVLLHSVFSNGLRIPPTLVERLRLSPAPKAYFVGNEYKMMPEKVTFAAEVGARLVVSQSSNPEVHQLYADRLGCAVVGIPGGGLDPGVFRPTSEFHERPIGLGMRAHDEPMYFGHQDRRAIASFFSERAGEWGLSTDLSFDPRRRLSRDGYAAFLNSCRGQLGTEGGPDFFELDDDLRERVNAYLKDKPDAPVEELDERFFSRYRRHRVSGRVITGRHVEAAGTKTVQILFEGNYNGILKPDVHYIPLRRDFTNAEEAIAKFRDDALCAQIVENAHELALAELTYDRLIDRFREGFLPVLERDVA